jgi:hypothetical protein
VAGFLHQQEKFLLLSLIHLDWESLSESPILDDPKEMVIDQKEKVEYREEEQKKK